jgi:hypothetical protein
MSDIIRPSAYNEPTVMWRMKRADDSSAHALIDTVDGRARVVWFVNGRPLGQRYFDDWTSAIQFTDRLRAQCWTVGWRLRVLMRRHATALRFVPSTPSSFALRGTL